MDAWDRPFQKDGKASDALDVLGKVLQCLGFHCALCKSEECLKLLDYHEYLVMHPVNHLADIAEYVEIRQQRAGAFNTGLVFEPKSAWSNNIDNRIDARLMVFAGVEEFNEIGEEACFWACEFAIQEWNGATGDVEKRVHDIEAAAVGNVEGADVEAWIELCGLV